MPVLSPAIMVVVFVTMLLATVKIQSQSHNITAILCDYPEFSTFTNYLTLTDLDTKINTQSTITVCAVDNAAMSQLLRDGPPLDTIRDLLSLHVILDYYDNKKLHQFSNGSVLAATMYQASGFASGSSGIINITDLRGGRVAFGAADNATIDAYFVKSVEEDPYEIAVIQISALMVPRSARAPPSLPVQTNVTNLMSAHGCGVFAETLLRNSNANKTFMENLMSGLTVFCPVDKAFNAFLPKYNSLSARDKESMLEFHGVAMYMSFWMMKSNNGVTNTLATDGSKQYQVSIQNEDKGQVNLKTEIMSTMITGKLIDKKPLAIFTLDKVLLPGQLLESASISPAPSPLPYSHTPSPKSSRRHFSPLPLPPAPALQYSSPSAYSPEEDDLADVITAATAPAARLKRWGPVTILSLTLLLLFLPLP